MSKTVLILKREYEAKVFTKAFFVLCIILPVLLSAMFMSTAINTNDRGSSKKESRVGDITFHVLDEDNLLNGNLPPIANMTFEKATSTNENILKNLKNNRIDGLLEIRGTAQAPRVKLFTNGEFAESNTRAISLNIQQMLGNKDTAIERISLETINVSVSNGQPKVRVNVVYGIALSCIIYFFIFFYGVRTLNAVIEEKMNRVSEIIISSVSPFELMMGKILGISLAVFTQVIVVIALTLLFTNTAMTLIMPDPVATGEHAIATQQQLYPGLLDTFSLGEWIKISIGFIMLFVFGFMLYAAVFAAIGAAMEPNEDTLQFVFPVLIPLVFSLIVVITSALSDPGNNVVLWASLIPFTSPVVMAMRLTQGVPWWQLMLSIIILVATFMAVIFLAGRIFRVGILLYGTKASLRTIGRWLFSTE